MRGALHTGEEEYEYARLDGVKTVVNAVEQSKRIAEDMDRFMRGL